MLVSVLIIEEPQQLNQYLMQAVKIFQIFLDRDMGDAPEQLYYQLHLIIHILPWSIDERFQSNVEQWFWPALCVHNPKLSITLRRFDNHECKDVQKIDISNNSQYKPFIDAFIGEANSNLKLGSTQFDVPEEKAGSITTY